MINVSIIIVSYNTKDLLLKCLKSIYKFTNGVSYEVIVVDNNSEDGTVELIKKSKFKIIQNDSNRGFGAANNQGIKIAKGKYVLLLNPDTELREDSISKMINWMDANPEVGISSCKLINMDGSIQPTGGFFPNIGRVFMWSTFLDDLPIVGGIFGSYHPKSGFYKTERSLDWVTGAFFLMRRELISDIRGFDEDYFLYVEEVDFCFRAKKSLPAGRQAWGISYVPITSVKHEKGASGTTEGMVTREMEGLKVFYGKHYTAIESILLRLLLLIGCLARIILFAIIKPNQSKIYARAITKI